MNHISTSKKIIITVIFIAIFYAAFISYSNLEKIVDIYQKMNYLYLIPIISIFIFSIFLRSNIQKILLEQIGIKLSIKENMLLFFAGLSMIITPGGSGQMIKSYLLKEKYDCPIMKSLPLVFFERFYDLLGICIVILATLIFIFSIESLVIVSVLIIILSVLVLIIKNQNFSQKIYSKLKKIKFLSNLLPDYSTFQESMLIMSNRSTVLKASISIIFITLLDGVLIYFGFLALDVDIGYLKSIQIYYTSLLLGALSFVPGGVGVMEGSFTVLLSKENLVLPLIISIVIFVRLTTIWLATGLGVIFSYVFSKKNSENNLE